VIYELQIYPFIIFSLYLYNDLFLPSLFLISILNLVFNNELKSNKNINHISFYEKWYQKNIFHEFSYHSIDIYKKDFKFLEQQQNFFGLYKVELLIFITMIIESEALLSLLKSFK
jgi:hypothetical protein